MSDAKAFKVDTLPCPECGNYTVIGYQFEDEHGNHQHTKYVCIFWSSEILRPKIEPVPRCGWEGWAVPGWDDRDGR